MSIKNILEDKKKELLKDLQHKAEIYSYWHTNLNPSDLRSIVDKIEEIEKELLK